MFSATYPLDQFNEECEGLFEQLSTLGVSVFANINVRAEFLENHRRVLIGESLIDFLEEAEVDIDSPLLEKLKAHRTSFRRKLKEERSAKMDLNQIKAFRRLFSTYQSASDNGWEYFCRTYLYKKLIPLWTDAQHELNLNFISLRSEDESPHLSKVPEWERATDIMGRYGLASADAMILNMFLCSKIPVLLTADLEMAECADKESKGARRIFVPDSALK